MLLLDDVESSREQPTSRLYQHVQEQWHANRFCELDACFNGIETALRHGHYVVALFAYELGYYWQGISCKHPEPLPLLRAWSFSEVSKLSKEAVDAFLHERLAIESVPSGILDRHDVLLRILRAFMHGLRRAIPIKLITPIECMEKPMAHPLHCMRACESGSQVAMAHSLKMVIRRSYRNPPNSLFDALVIP
jgi:hypothetical protein